MIPHSLCQRLGKAWKNANSGNSYITNYHHYPSHQYLIIYKIKLSKSSFFRIIPPHIPCLDPRDTSYNNLHTTLACHVLLSVMLLVHLCLGVRVAVMVLVGFFTMRHWFVHFGMLTPRLKCAFDSSLVLLAFCKLNSAFWGSAVLKESFVAFFLFFLLRWEEAVGVCNCDWRFGICFIFLLIDGFNGFELISMAWVTVHEVDFWASISRSIFFASQSIQKHGIFSRPIIIVDDDAYVDRIDALDGVWAFSQLC